MKSMKLGTEQYLCNSYDYSNFVFEGIDINKQTCFILRLVSVKYVFHKKKKTSILDVSFCFMLLSFSLYVL